MIIIYVIYTPQTLYTVRKPNRSRSKRTPFSSKLANVLTILRSAKHVITPARNPRPQRRVRTVFATKSNVGGHGLKHGGKKSNLLDVFYAFENVPRCISTWIDVHTTSTVLP